MNKCHTSIFLFYSSKTSLQEERRAQEKISLRFCVKIGISISLNSTMIDSGKSKQNFQRNTWSKSYRWMQPCSLCFSWLTLELKTITVLFTKSTTNIKFRDLCFSPSTSPSSHWLQTPRCRAVRVKGQSLNFTCWSNGYYRGYSAKQLGTFSQKL